MCGLFVCLCQENKRLGGSQPVLAVDDDGTQDEHKMLLSSSHHNKTLSPRAVFPSLSPYHMRTLKSGQQHWRPPSPHDRICHSQITSMFEYHFRPLFFSPCRRRSQETMGVYNGLVSSAKNTLAIEGNMCLVRSGFHMDLDARIKIYPTLPH